MNEEKLLEIKEKLDKASNELTKRILDHEAYLNSLRLGVSGWVKTNEETSLGYVKIDGKWGIYVRYKAYKGVETETVSKLIDAPRGLRLHGYKHMHELLPAILEGAESLTERIEKVLTGVKTDEVC